MAPKVTFVVPCYNLAEVLPDCINSILAQTFEDFEVLVMDDCSPDATPEVARSFGDPRIRHIRNETNLKHLANYNKGIGMASGRYIWLISADDRLRKPYILERYVTLMDENPQVGYVYCPAVALTNGQETEVLPWSYGGEQDEIYDGREFFRRLLPSNCISSPSAMVRAECYRIAEFPLNMPYAGDWYLWCLFALHHDVAYLAEPMVCYRLHEKSYTSVFTSEDTDVMAADEINVRWRILEKAQEIGEKALASRCLDFIINDYASRIYIWKTQNHRQGLTFEKYEKSLISNAQNIQLEKYVRARVLCSVANNYYADKDFSTAITYYRATIKERPQIWKAWLKYVLAVSQKKSLKSEKNLSVRNIK